MFALEVNANDDVPVITSNSFNGLNADSDGDDGPPNLSDSDSDLEADPELNPHPTALLNEVVYRRYLKAKREKAEAPKVPKKTHVDRQKDVDRQNSWLQHARLLDCLHIKSIADFDLPSVQGLINALPRDKKSLSRLAKLCPSKEETLGPYERWVMADSGSSLHALDVAKELPGYEHLVVPLPVGKKGRGAETASGDKVEIRGTVSLAGHIDGHEHVVPFNDMKISMPIASMRQTIKKGNDPYITPSGGTIKNRKTGKTIKLHERGGVYFFKMTFLPPHLQPCSNDQDKGRKNMSLGFARPA